jgi:Ser/Thr protein kinase RdoA (MazF antagonist)
MENIYRVTTHLHKKLRSDSDATRKTLVLIPAADGNYFYYNKASDNYWRCYIFVEKAHTYDVIETPRQAFEAAKAFGHFQEQLVNLPGGRLFETIPDFHHTPKRYDALEAAIEADCMDRAKNVQAEIDFALNRKEEAGKLVRLLEAGELPERITHNDTKLNNVMLDECTGRGVCVIDLDTVMPGLVHYDFGDMVRTSTSPAAEDEKDLSKVTMQFHMFEALLRGYLTSAEPFLTPLEKELLPFSGKLITLEIGVRFLTDYLAGDVYFKTHREEHNLDRCRTQFKLVESIEAQMDKMVSLLNELSE